MIALDLQHTQSFADVTNVTAVLVMMGSNDNAEAGMALALLMIQKNPLVLNCKPMSIHVSADHTKRSQNLYHNQALIINFGQAVMLSAVITWLKAVERYCGRDESQNNMAHGYLVAMDIDVMAVCIKQKWFVMQERLPLKAHEIACLNM